MKKTIISIILFQLILYNSQYLLTSTTGTSSLTPQPKLPEHLIPNAKAASDNDTIQHLNRRTTIPEAKPKSIANIFTTDSLMPTRNFPNDTDSQTDPSFFSRFFNKISNTTSEFLFGKNVENEFWKTFVMDTILEKFQNEILHEDKCKEIIISLIEKIKNQYLIAIKILFNKYLAVDKDIMKTIEPYLAKGTTLTAFPSSPSVLIATPYAVEGNLDTVEIPKIDLSVYAQDYLTKIESTWLLNLHINYTKSDFMYTHFNYLKFKTKMMSPEEIMKTTKGLQFNIHYLYRKDLDDLKKRMELLLNFIIEKFTTQTPEIDKILYSIPNPNITTILFKNDSPEKTKEKISKFTFDVNL